MHSQAKTWPQVFQDIAAGQDRAKEQLAALVKRSPHALLFVGHAGLGKLAAARAYAAALLCSESGCGNCDVCSRVLRGIHPDVILIQRQGASISAEEIREVNRQAFRSPVEGSAQVIIIEDLHLVENRAPMLLKTIEEPPEGTYFVLLAEAIPSEPVTIASRCVRVEFRSLPTAQIETLLRARGVQSDRVASAAALSGGSLERALLLATDESVSSRYRFWYSLPEHLDSSGSSVAVAVSQIVDLLEASSSQSGLLDRHKTERRALEESAKLTGLTAAETKRLDDRHKREVRRLRTDELRSGLRAVCDRYRAELVNNSDVRFARAVLDIEAFARELVRNPNEQLFLSGVLCALPPLARLVR